MTALNLEQIANLADECGFPALWCDDIASGVKPGVDPVVQLVRRLEREHTAETTRLRERNAELLALLKEAYGYTTAATNLLPERIKAAIAKAEGKP